MKVLFLFALSVALVKSDEVFGPFNVLGGSIPTGLDAYGRQLVSSAQHNPNATRSIGFKPFLAATENSSTLFLGDIEWTWRVNVSDFAAPNARAWGETVDPHVVSTAYDFSWSDNSGILSDQLNRTNSGFCLSVVDWNDLPVNITNAYAEKDGNDTSCVPVLGQACVNAILSNGRNFRGATCPGPKELWSEFPECRSTLGYMERTPQGFGTISVPRGLGNSSGNTTGTLANGEGWFATFSAPQNGSGSTPYYTAANQLQIAMVSAVLSLDNDGGYLEGSELLCMRVNATQLPTRDTNGDGITWTSEAVMESMGSFAQPSVIWVLSVITAYIFIYSLNFS